MSHQTSRPRRILNQTGAAIALRLILLLLLVLPAISHPEELVWQQLTAEAPWQARAYHGAVLHHQKMYVVAGEKRGSPVSDIWVSEHGIEWTRVIEEAPWLPRSYFGCISWNDKLCVYGGHYGWFLLDDLWLSGDGNEWAKIFDASIVPKLSASEIPVWPSGPFSMRFWAAYTQFENKLLVVGGERVEWEEKQLINNSDIWSSANAQQWNLVEENCAWSARSEHSVVEFQSQLYLMGGITRSEKGTVMRSNEVWRSSNLKDWSVACHAPWAKRGHALVVATNEVMLLLGGLDRDVFSDVWMTNDGEHWQQCGVLPEGCGRHGVAGLINDGLLYIFGGREPDGSELADVWVADVSPLALAP